MIEDIMYEKEMKYTKCKTCLFRKNFGLQKLTDPCAYCKDRPGRNKDKSEYVEELSDKQEQEKHSNEREGKFKY